MNHANMSPPDLVGRIVLGRYRVVRAIGRGGMGVIYLARSEGAAGFVKPFVIKQATAEIVAHGDSMITQLAREARIMSNLRHPGIVSVIDFAEDAGSYLLVLDYVQGYNLGQWRKFVQHTKTPFSTEFALHIVERVLDALEYAHTLTRSDGAPMDIVHRDISPGNVLLDIEGHVKLADFGVARMTSDQTEASDQGMIKGKISYMAPELFARAPPTPSSDVYACAVMLHELLVGRNEFKADNVHMTAMRVMQHVPSDVSALRSDVPAELDRVLKKALAKSQAERYPSARALAEALNALRTIPPEQTARRLAARVRVDFNDAAMADFLGVEDPTTLERAWRETATTATKTLSLSQGARHTFDPDVPIFVDEPAPAGSGSAVNAPSVPTVAAAPVALGTPPLALAREAARGHSWSMALGIGGLLAGACALVLVLRSRAAQDGPERVIVVDSRAGASAPTAQATASAAFADPPAVPTVETAPRLAGGAPSAVASAAPAPSAQATGTDGNAAALTHVLSRRQDAIATCFANRAADVQGTPGLSVRFDIDASGHVLSAHVLPAALAATPLGQCIEGVARETDFGPQPRALSFRIPMTAHRN